MRKSILIRSLITATLLILAIPVAASAQAYNRDSRNDRRDVRDAINRLDISTVQLESDLNFNRGRIVFGVLWVGSTEDNAVAEVRDFRRAVRDLKNRSNNGRDLSRSSDEARLVLDRGVRLDRDWRLRAGSTRVDSDLAEVRANLQTIADAYDLSMHY